MTPTNVPIYEEWIGTLDGFVNAQIRAQVSGYISKQDYAEGSEVKKGALLFEIDPRPFQAVLEQAKARLAQDEAQVQKSRLDVERYQPLAKDQAVSQQDLDNALQAYASAQAMTNADRAAIDAAVLNLGFTKIVSPIDGVAGQALVQLGDLVGPSGSILTTVSQLNPMRVYFQVSEHSYLTFWTKLIDNPTNQLGSSLPLELILSDGSVYPEKGRFFFAGREVNVNTGTLQIAGLFPNPHGLLRPGQYALVRAQTQTRTNALLVPQRAVTELQGTYQVDIIGDSNRVSVVSLKLGPVIGSDWLVEKGLHGGEHVIVEGLQKAKPGETVNPQPFGQNQQLSKAPTANESASR